MLLTKGQIFLGTVSAFYQCPFSGPGPHLVFSSSCPPHPFQISAAGCETAHGAALWVGLDPASNYQVLVIGVIVMSFLLRRWVPSTCTQRPMWGPCWRKWILVYIRAAVTVIIIVQDGSSGRGRRGAHFTHLFLQPWKKHKWEMLPTLVLRMKQAVQGRPISWYSLWLTWSSGSLNYLPEKPCSPLGTRPPSTMKVRWDIWGVVIMWPPTCALKLVQWLGFPVLIGTGTSGNKTKNPAVFPMLMPVGVLLSLLGQDAVCFHRSFLGETVDHMANPWSLACDLSPASEPGPTSLGLYR